MADSETKISVRENGPYIVANVKALRNANGAVLETNPRFALCRCGQSSTKPFCDGTHNKVGFSGPRGRAAGDKVDDYAAPEVTIHDNRALCAHSGVCTDRLASVFQYGKEPWIVPGGGTVEQVAQAVRACPSGALSYTVGGKREGDSQREPEIQVTKDGPYHVTGGVVLEEVERNQGASPEHYALCRCGQSRNKPFCDGSHWDAKFSDPGA